jgi:recombination protein RecA
MPKLELKKLSTKQKLLKNKKKEIQEEKEITNNKYFVSSGSNLLNMALTGNIYKGYCRGRIVNIKGGYSTAKTIAACELINSVYYIDHLKYGKKVKIIYCEAESAFDEEFARKLYVPIDFVKWKDPDTIEDFHKIIEDEIKDSENYDLVLIILDTLDALTDKKEQEEIRKALKSKKDDGEEVDEEKVKGSYGAQFAKYMSKFFRTLKRKLRKSNCLLCIVSQLRDDLKAKYGSGSTTSGGRALGFYCTQRIDLKKIMKLYMNEQSKKNKMPYGVKIEAVVEKNKLYPEGRRCEFDVIINPPHGFENIGSLIDFCIKYGSIEKEKNSFIWNDEHLTKEKLRKLIEGSKDNFEQLLEISQQTWNELEESSRSNVKPKWQKLDIATEE